MGRIRQRSCDRAVALGPRQPVDPKTLPFMEQVLPGPDGPLLFDTGGGAHPCSTVPKRIRVPGGDDSRYCQNGPDLWRSDDALSWEPLTLPVKARFASLTLQDGTYWLATQDPTELWRSNDAERWEPIDLSALEPTSPASLQWEAELGTPVTSNGQTVVPVMYRALDAGRLLGQDEFAFAWPESTERPGRYRVMVAYQTRVANEDEVLIEEDGSGLVFERPDGSRIATLEGVDLGFVEAWSANRQIAERSFARIDDMAAVPASVTGVIPPAGPWKAEPPAVLATPDGFDAYLLDDRDGTIRDLALGRRHDLGTRARRQPRRADRVRGKRWERAWTTHLRRRARPGVALARWGHVGAQRPGRTSLAVGPCRHRVPDRPQRARDLRRGHDRPGRRRGRVVPAGDPRADMGPGGKGADGVRLATLGDTIFVWIGYRDGLVDRHLWVIERWEPSDG